jgi:hypothetical protein
VSDKPAHAGEREPDDDSAAAPDESRRSDAEKAAEIAEEKEKSGAESVV